MNSGHNKEIKKTGARYLAETINAYGVTHAFFVTAILRRTLVEMEDLGIKRIVVHSEKAAAYMADGFARISGKPGLCMAQSVGAANLAAGLQDACLGHVPVIAVTGRKGPAFQYRNAYQEIIHEPMFRPVTKFRANIDNAEQLPVLLRQAFREATSGTPQPVHLDCAGLSGEDIEGQSLTEAPEADQQFMQCPTQRTVPEEDLINKALARLEAASRPVIVIGRGAHISGAAEEVGLLADTLSIPVASTNDGRSILPDNHPMQAGVVGTYSWESANRIVSEADLVIFIGSSISDQVTCSWTIPSPGTPVIQIDINPSETGRNYPDTLGLAGDAKATLQQILKQLKNKPDFQAWSNHAQTLVAEWKASHEALRLSDNRPIRPERLCHEISKILPSNAVLVSDTGYSAIWSSTMLELTHPGQSYLRAAGSLGWAFPASLGAKCAVPDRPVFCFCGDGAFWYHLSELETARRCGINTITVVNNNSAYGQSVAGFEQAYGNDKGKIEEVYQFESTNFARLAENMGCLGLRVETPEEISGALEEALKADRPVVIDAATDLNCRPPAMWTPSDNKQ
ncbi:MAG: thiamine pyrophosphate-binding protein [Planctomycetota bacterium]